MAKLSPNLQHLTDELPADKRADIEAAIMSSPHLRQIMTEAVNAGTLEHIRMGMPGANEGGHYDDRKRAIYLSPDTFTDPILKSRPEQRLDMITSTLGHETGHALYADKARKELYFTTGSITDGIRAAGPGGEFDATGLVGAYIRDARRNEAQAEIHGWDALASRIEYTKGAPPSRDEMLERARPTTNCIDGPQKSPRLETGIVLDADMHMSDTRLPKAGPINLEPVAQCHFDQSGQSLGTGGGANYTNYYGAYLVQQLADDTRNWVNPPTIKMDMAKLGLDKAQLESTGLRLGDEGFSLIDTSRNSYKQVTLRSNGSGIQGSPDEQEPALTGPSPSATPTIRDSAAPLLDNPAHPNHGMYATLLAVVHERDRELGRTPDEHSKQLAGALTEQALAKGINNIGAAKFSDDGKTVGMTNTPNLYAEWARTSAGNAAELADRPLAQSSEGATKLSEQMEQVRTHQAQTQTQTSPTHDDPALKGPKL